MNKLPLNQVLCGDCREVMASWPEAGIDLVVTSPPYWGLRDYGHEDQIGLEPHPQKYIDNLVNTSQEIRRILKPKGSYWLNLGDTYFSKQGNNSTYNKDTTLKGNNERWHYERESDGSNWLQPKQLLGIPWRAATALQHDGWILRNCVIWYKPNHMPSSVKDRLTTSYEFIFFLVKQKKYYFNLDRIRVPHQTKGDYKDYTDKIHISERSKRDEVLTRNSLGKPNHPIGKNPGDTWPAHGPNTGSNNKEPYKQNNPHLSRILHGTEAGHIKGKNPGDFWEIPTYPFPGAHFAVFPPALIEPIIKAACPKNGVVLDPFAGSGTALRVARKLGRRFIGIDINSEYVEMSERRVRADSYSPPPEGVPTLTELLDRE